MRGAGRSVLKRSGPRSADTLAGRDSLRDVARCHQATARRPGGRPSTLSLDAKTERDFTLDAWRWHVAASTKHVGALELFANQLGLPLDVLLSLEVGASEENRWSFPMLNRHGAVVGIRLRCHDGSKFAVTGSRNGLFYCEPLTDPIIVVEGPTDAGAAMALGFSAVGRASANPGHVADGDLAQLLAGRSVVIIEDADETGRKGVTSLVAKLVRLVRDFRVIRPTGWKDLRAALQAGLTREQLESAIEAAAPVRVGCETGVVSNAGGAA